MIRNQESAVTDGLIAEICDILPGLSHPLTYRSRWGSDLYERALYVKEVFNSCLERIRQSAEESDQDLWRHLLKTVPAATVVSDGLIPAFHRSLDLPEVRSLLLDLLKRMRESSPDFYDNFSAALDASRFVRALARGRSLADLIEFQTHPAEARAIAIERRYPLGFPEIFDSELEEIAKLRLKRSGHAEPGHVSGDIADRAWNSQLFGLCLSGGGIRSATFALGILQAMAQLKILGWFDYLSTVSGGGYIGSWLVAWIKRQRFASVEEQLAPDDKKDPTDERRHPLHFLRAYSNYLTPRTGLFSADAWTLGVIWLRNTVLNLIIVVAGISALLLIPRLAAIVPASGWKLPDTWGSACWLIYLGGLIVSAIFMCLNMRRFHNCNATAPGESSPRLAEDEREPRIYTQRGVVWGVCIPVLIGCLGAAAAIWSVRMSWEMRLANSVIVFTGLILTACFGGVLRCFKAEQNPTTGRWFKAITGGLLACLVPAALFSLLLYVLDSWINAGRGQPEEFWRVIVIGPPLVLGALLISLFSFIGLMGSLLPDDRREWLSRAGALLLIFDVVYLLWFGVSIYGPPIGAKMFELSYSGLTLAGTWLLSTIFGLIAGHSPGTSGSLNEETGRGNKLLEWIAVVAPYVFIAGLFLALSFGIHKLTGGTVIAGQSTDSSRPEYYYALFDLPSAYNA